MARTEKEKIYTLLIIYVLCFAAASVYHAYNFSDYSRMKGSETINYIFLVFAGSVLFEVIAANLTTKIDWKAAIFGTVVNFLLSLIIGFVIIMVGQLDGTPFEMILIFGACNLVILTIVTIGQVFRLGG